MYTAADVALHNTASDCWIICENRVLDVTRFLASHPGGVAALSKPGRAGEDVTNHFVRIGHSKKARQVMLSMQIGSLSLTPSTHSTSTAFENTFTTTANNKNNKNNTNNADDASHDLEKERAIQWHADRRKAILAAHPSIANLAGHNPFSPFLGIFAAILHCYCCVLAQRTSWTGAFVLAYTVGAVCKMWQFAICHDICHGTAGALLERFPILKHTAMHLSTLPAFGGSTHMYYSFQHVGHHSSLGSQSTMEVAGTSGGYGLSSKTFLMPDSDGDAFAVGTLSLGKLLMRWKSSMDDDGGPGRLQREYVGQHSEYIMDIHTNTLANKLLKCILAQLSHVAFHFSLIGPNVTLAVLLWPPVSVALMLMPETWIVSGNKARELVMRMFVRVAPSTALHNWAWIVLGWWLLFRVGGGGGEQGGVSNDVLVWTWVSVAKGVWYLWLSELFLYGFLFHPFMGYFLGTHRSGGEGFKKKVEGHDSAGGRGGGEGGGRGAYASVRGTDDDPEEANDGGGSGGGDTCQPTMSTYSASASAACLYLTHHVEHHDFPNVPWSRLFKITELAPEFYNDLEQSPGFCSTIWRWIQFSGGWSYSCQ